ncbi:TonB-dependent receptor plug domain-containing protein [Sphingobacterium haloxyli]|uniref:TonB-dependent receptor plug domain-containing protein n=1 Tax=Sphingobacterium haloxyli TaxID=2100533 RepID=A0A2S9J9G8_9SPHI|nr:TonB-dependent receptor plug domain-containing protein [Sphingobacterium haloxyli]PRD49377.1 hypothetical protein C5745_01800 [Sphingobacterium haloxyli]
MITAVDVMSQTQSIFVSDSQSGVPIAHANVMNHRTGKTLMTDDAGTCRIVAINGDKLSVSHVAYQDTVFIIIPNITRFEIGLRPRELSAVDIYAGEAFNRRAAQGIHNVPLRFLTSVPTFFGEPDILKALTFLPGVSEGREGYSHLFVRGGDQDQNQILFDGATMFNVNHFGGFISMFHPEMIGGVDFYKSYWPSRYGGRLSSVLDIRTAEGNYKEHRQTIQLGLIAPKISASGPLWKDRVSYHVGARRTIIDMVTGPIARKIRSGKRDGDIGNLVTQDMNLRIDGRIASNQHVSLSALHSRDRHSLLENYPRYDQFVEDQYGIKNEVVTLNYRLEAGLYTSLSAHASYSGYRHYYQDFSRRQDISYTDGTTDQNNLVSSRHSGNSMRSMKLNVHGKSRLHDRWELQYGVEREWLDYNIYLNREEAVNGSVVNTFDGKIGGNGITNTALSADLYHRLSDRLDINTGLRLSRYISGKYDRWLPEPKILATFMLDENATVNAAFNLQRQHTAMLGFTDDMGRFREFYVTSEHDIPPSVSRQWSVGYFRNTSGLLDNFSVELFYKKQSDVVKYVPSVDFDRDVLEYHDYLHRKGLARVYGAEFLLQKTTGALHGSLSYTYARSRSSFSTLNNGQWFNADFDFRHSANILLMYRFGKGYRLSGHWTYKTGRPFTMPSSEVASDDRRSRFQVITDINNMRMPAFHRLDLNIERRWISKKGRKNWFGMGVYNLYNRVNPFFAQPDDDPGKLEIIGMFPLIPFFNIGFEL